MRPVLSYFCQNILAFNFGIVISHCVFSVFIVLLIYKFSDIMTKRGGKYTNKQISFNCHLIFVIGDNLFLLFFLTISIYCVALLNISEIRLNH